MMDSALSPKAVLDNSVPEPVREILQAISEIRRTVLVESPRLLPMLAPAMLRAESGIDKLWQ